MNYHKSNLYTILLYLGQNLYDIHQICHFSSQFLISCVLLFQNVDANYFILFYLDYSYTVFHVQSNANDI